LLVAAILLPFDVGVRRLVISGGDLARARRRFAEWARLRQPAPQRVHERTEQLGALFRAKDRAGGETPAEAEDEAALEEPVAVAVADAPAAGTPLPVAAAPAAKAQEKAPTGDQPESKPEQAKRPSGTELASSLLAKKKAREESEKKDGG
jgi:hypothetical protein